MSEDVQPIVWDIWNGKYRWKRADGTSDENSREDSLVRMVNGVYAKDKNKSARKSAMDAVKALEWCPAGRVHAGAGTDKRVTLINCFVLPTIEDSVGSSDGVGIFDALTVAALTQQMGGGIGTDFSTIRPNGSLVKRTGSISSGILPFADVWHTMCTTIMSAGGRRGAMMATLMCDHPDLWNPDHYEMREDGKLRNPSFISAKREVGRLTNFNVSVMVTDQFMANVEGDGMWDLGFHVPRADGNHVAVYDKDGAPWYVYQRVKARRIWDDIIQNTYDHAEPGIIFIDRVNQLNNLNYCEHIQCTNPCGEQPLPPDGDCNLGAVNLAALVTDPFTNDAKFNFSRLREVAAIGVRFLDNVLDVSLFPTGAQRLEAMHKRRIGLGITGLGNMLQMMRSRYGSRESVAFVEAVMFHLADAAYRCSALLAKERGAFPLYDADKFNRHYLEQLSPDTIKCVNEYGLRNGVLLTTAPVGTTSIYYNNISSGLEPTFSWAYNRDVLQDDGTKREYEEVRDYGYDLFCKLVGREEGKRLPDYMVTALELGVDDHLAIQAAVQKYVDASVSKTINCPQDMSFEKFKDVYRKAYDLGLKGCTTYRPNPDSSRGSVLRVKEKDKVAPVLLEKLPRESIMHGSTYKMPWSLTGNSFYITINNITLNGVERPFEIFINSKSALHDEWAKALTRLISAIFRRGEGDVTFLVEELEQIHSAAAGTWVEGHYIPSVPALIGYTLRKHFASLGLMDDDKPVEADDVSEDQLMEVRDVSGEMCPKCSKFSLVHQEGCDKCLSCGHSTCG